MTVRALIVEDDPVIALEIEHALRSAGFEIANCVPSIPKALAALKSCECDFAVLDANLRGESVEPAAVALKNLGKPFLFVSGYGRAHLPARFLDIPLLAKPFNAAELIRSVNAILKPDRATHAS
jgi:DNA-binding response OmpR family regulator